MTDQHQIIPPPELVQEWWEEADQYQDDPKTYFDHVATQAARWGSDMELEACCAWMDNHLFSSPSTPLRAARRPKPPSLRELALASVKRFEESGEFFSDQMRELEFIRKALEQLND